MLYTEFQKDSEAESFNIEHFNNIDMQPLMQLLGVFMPIAKLKKENSFLIGTEVKQLTVKNDNCMVRVGGGYVTIKEYYNRYATKQCVQLF